MALSTTNTIVSPDQALDQFVTRALEEQAKSRNGARSRVYQTLLSQLLTAGAHRYYGALAKCASMIKSESNSPLSSPFSALLSVVFEVDYSKCSIETAFSHVEFLLHLALANSGLVSPCFRVFCQSFKAELWEGRNQVYDRIHAALKQILHLSPLASVSLMEVILEVYPHQRSETSVQEVFIKNLLEITLYSNSLRNRIVSLVIERLVALDVEVAGHLELSGVEDSKSPTDDPNALQDKLDQLLELLFEFLARVRSARELNAEEIRHSLWECLLSVFEKTLLKAHKARCLPFLVFYHARTQAKYAERFLGLLRNKACDRQCSEPERIHAAAFLAGFVARAAYIHATQIRSLFDDIVDDLHQYCLETEEALLENDLELKIGSASAQAHLVFYALFQALMHMFNRRLFGDIEIREDKLKQWEYIQHIIKSYLAPFRYCLPNTVAEFRQRTLELELLDNHEEGEVSKLHAFGALDDLFYIPFEPMPLSLCAAFINDDTLYLPTPSLNTLYLSSTHAHPSPHELRPPARFSKRDNSPALHSVSTPLLRTPLTDYFLPEAGDPIGWL